MTVTGVDWSFRGRQTVFLHRGVCIILDGCQAPCALHRVLMGHTGFFTYLGRCKTSHSQSAYCVPDTVLSALDIPSVRAPGRHQEKGFPTQV